MIQFPVGGGVGKVGFMDFGDEFEDFGDLAFGDFIHLKVDFFSEGINSRLAVLAHEDKDGEEYGLEGHNHGQEAIGEGVDGREPRNFAGVRQDPEAENYDMSREEGETASQAIDIVS